MKEREKSVLYIYNSLSREKEEFKPMNPPFVGLYVCGPTVYGDPHLGHARSALSFDVIYRYLKKLGYRVRYVRNITDVGHMEFEISESGEDKILKKARLEEVEPMEIVQRYTIRYHKAMDALNCLRPDIEPTASGHIIEQINLVKKIFENGYAYEVNGNIYFDLEKFRKDESYGELSGKVLEDLQSGSRDTAGMDEKKSPHDFALWKRATQAHIMRWESPWGEGYPGWHLECTAMSTKYLGERFDIHGGGLDLQFPHHEAEIAQCKGAYGHGPVTYWIHNNMITMDGAKMSKSAGNFINLEDLFSGNHEKLAKNYNPMVVRFLMLQSHYRSKIDFSNDALEAAEKGYTRLMAAMHVLSQLVAPSDLEAKDKKLDNEIAEACERCHQTMNDDFNTAQTLAAVFELVSKINAFHNQQSDIKGISSRTYHYMCDTLESFVFDVMGLKQVEKEDKGLTEELIHLLVELRLEAKGKRDFQTSDRIRDDLQAIGVKLKDDKSGTTFEIDH